MQLLFFTFELDSAEISRGQFQLWVEKMWPEATSLSVVCNLPLHRTAPVKYYVSVSMPDVFAVTPPAHAAQEWEERRGVVVRPVFDKVAIVRDTGSRRCRQIFEEYSK